MPGSRSIRDQMQRVPPRAYGAPMGPAIQAPNTPSAPSAPRPVAGPAANPMAAHQAAVAGGLYRKPLGAPAGPMPVQRPQPAAAAPGPSPTDPNNPTRDLSAGHAAQNVGLRGVQIDRAVDRMAQ